MKNNIMSLDFLLIEILGNSIQSYLLFFGAILIGLIFKRLISRYLSRLLFKIVKNKDSQVGIDRFDSLLTKPLGFCVMLLIIYIGSSNIQYPITWNLSSENEFGLKMFISKGFYLVFVCSIIWILLKMIDFVGLILKKKAELTENKMMIN